MLFRLFLFEMRKLLISVNFNEWVSDILSYLSCTFSLVAQFCARENFPVRNFHVDFYEGKIFSDFFPWGGGFHMERIFGAGISQGKGEKLIFFSHPLEKFRVCARTCVPAATNQNASPKMCLKLSALSLI